jgi:hypothetical protein
MFRELRRCSPQEPVTMVIISKQVSKATGSVISSQADHRQLSGYSLSAAHDPQQITPAALVFGRCKTFRRLLLASRIVPFGRANERALRNVTTSWDQPSVCNISPSSDRDSLAPALPPLSTIAPRLETIGCSVFPGFEAEYRRLQGHS